MIFKAQERYIEVSRFLHKRMLDNPGQDARYERLMTMNELRFSRQIHKEADVLKEDIIRTCRMLMDKK